MGKNRARGLAGYDVALTWRRSGVRISAGPYFYREHEYFPRDISGRERERKGVFAVKKKIGWDGGGIFYCKGSSSVWIKLYKDFLFTD